MEQQVETTCTLPNAVSTLIKQHQDTSIHIFIQITIWTKIKINGAIT